MFKHHNPLGKDKYTNKAFSSYRMQIEWCDLAATFNCFLLFQVLRHFHRFKTFEFVAAPNHQNDNWTKKDFFKFTLLALVPQVERK